MPATSSTQTLLDFGFASGTFLARPDDGLTLRDARITNAVRCVPPENKPNGQEIAHCRDFLRATIAEMPNLAAIVALGRIAHDTTAVALGRRVSSLKFGHGGDPSARRHHPFRQLSLLALQHEHRRADAARCSARCSTAVRSYLDARSHATTASAL